MAKAVYPSINGSSRKTKKCYFGDNNNLSRKILKCYIGDDSNKSRLFFLSFPEQPSAYNLISTYREATTFTAPADGWYQIELFGAAGNGGNGNGDSSTFEDDPDGFAALCIHGGSGGGGAYCCSRVALNKGDTVVFAGIEQHGTATIVINSSHNSSYSHTMTCESGGIGGGGIGGYMAAGKAGSASGGNYSNINGNAGNTGVYWVFATDTTEIDESSWVIIGLVDKLIYMPSECTTRTTPQTQSGSPAVSGGNVGGKSAYWTATYTGSENEPITLTQHSRTLGGTAYMKIYAGNTNET